MAEKQVPLGSSLGTDASQPPVRQTERRFCRKTNRCAHTLEKRFGRFWPRATLSPLSEGAPKSVPWWKIKNFVKGAPEEAIPTSENLARVESSQGKTKERGLNPRIPAACIRLHFSKPVSREVHSSAKSTFD